MVQSESYVVRVLPGRWGDIKNETLIQEFSAIFRDRPVIEFTDWAEVSNASEFWDGLCRDVVKTLKKRDLQFIFHLGDVAHKPICEIDEVLDIISDYSSYGKVVLKLDCHEADSLWCRLNGCDRKGFPADMGAGAARERWLSIFNTMNIDLLQILEGCQTMQFSR
jgi:hypothetical protein